MSDYTVVDAQRNQIGPVPESEVRKLLASGVISLDSLAWRPGMGGWEPLRAFSEFIDVPNPPEGSFNPYAPPMAVNLFPVTADGIDLNLPSSVRAQTLTHEILQRGYQLDIFSCIRRGWNLVFSGNFWEIIGVCALTGFILAPVWRRPTSLRGEPPVAAAAAAAADGGASAAGRTMRSGWSGLLAEAAADGDGASTSFQTVRSCSRRESAAVGSAATACASACAGRRHGTGGGGEPSRATGGDRARAGNTAGAAAGERTLAGSGTSSASASSSW